MQPTHGLDHPHIPAQPMNWVFPCFLILILILASAQGPWAATEVCGTLRMATEWTARGSPYLVTGDVYVPNTSRLTIEAGVKVRFAKPGATCPAEDGAPPPVDWADSAYTGLKIQGPFHCIGTESNPIVFEPEDPKSGTVGWDGLRLTGQDIHSAEIAFAWFKGANQALAVDRSAFYIHHVLFEANNTGIALGPRGDVSVLNCNFASNSSAGISISKARPRIAGNLFLNNRSYGIWADDLPGSLIAYNAFSGNREEHCFRCPYPLLFGLAGKPGGDTLADSKGNRVADPVFLGSEAHKAALRVDESTDTPLHLVKDKEMAKAEAAARPKWYQRMGRSGESQGEGSFQPLGKGPYVLSAYSRLRDAGPPGKAFRDRDGTRNDIGLHGGPMERITVDPF